MNAVVLLVILAGSDELSAVLTLEATSVPFAPFSILGERAIKNLATPVALWIVVLGKVLMTEGPAIAFMVVDQRCSANTANEAGRMEMMALCFSKLLATLNVLTTRVAGLETRTVAVLALVSSMMGFEVFVATQTTAALAASPMIEMVFFVADCHVLHCDEDRLLAVVADGSSVRSIGIEVHVSDDVVDIVVRVANTRKFGCFKSAWCGCDLVNLCAMGLYWLVSTGNLVRV